VLILVFVSILSWIYIIEKMMRFKSYKVNPDIILKKLRDIMTRSGKFNKSNVPEAIRYLKDTPGPVAEVLKTGLMYHEQPKEIIEEEMKKAAMKELLKLNQNVVMLGSIGSASPFIGLLGTVIGVTEAFRMLAVSGGGGMSVVGYGIAQALVATIIGLFAAIPAVVAYNYFLKRINDFTEEIAISSSDLINILLNITKGESDD
jgi:biopolymer transport protein ExbB/TolQ